MRIGLFLGFLLLAWRPAAGQLTETATLPFGYRVTVNGTWLSGNVDRFLVAGGAELAWVGEQWAFRSSNTYQYGTSGAFTTENDLFLKQFLYWQPRSRVYPYLMVWTESNRRRDYRLRYQLGPGISWGVLSKELHQLKLSATLTLEQTHFNRSFPSNSPNAGQSSIQTPRATLRLYGQHRIGPRGWRLRYEMWGQPSLRYIDNYRLHGDWSWELPVSKVVALRTTFNYNYERVVLPQVKRQDTFWVLGITLANFR